MEVEVLCSKNMKLIVAELLKSRKIELSSASKIAIVEKGFDIPEGKIAIVFEYDTIDMLIELLDAVEMENSKKLIYTGKREENYHLIKHDEITLFENINNSVYMVKKNEKYQVKEKLYELEGVLDKGVFFRVSKSYIVNVMKIQEIVPWFSGKLILKMESYNQDVIVTRSYCKEFKKFLGI